MQENKQYIIYYEYDILIDNKYLFFLGRIYFSQVGYIFLRQDIFVQVGYILYIYIGRKTPGSPLSVFYTNHLSTFVLFFFVVQKITFLTFSLNADPKETLDKLYKILLPNTTLKYMHHKNIFSMKCKYFNSFNFMKY